MRDKVKNAHTSVEKRRPNERNEKQCDLHANEVCLKIGYCCLVNCMLEHKKDSSLHFALIHSTLRAIHFFSTFLRMKWEKIATKRMNEMRERDMLMCVVNAFKHQIES